MLNKSDRKLNKKLNKNLNRKLNQEDKEMPKEEEEPEGDAADYSIKNSLLSDKSKYKKAVVAMVVLALLMFGAGMKYARFLDGKPLTDVAEASSIVQTDSLDNPVASTDLVVKVEGCADKTGYFSVSGSTSLRELIEYVNVTPDGDISDFEFTHKLQQGDCYYIKDVNNPVDAAVWLANETGGAEEANADGSENAEGSDNSDNSDGDKININTADLAKLTELEGIGETKAQAIIDYREKHGGFNRTEDILAVKGIGEKTYDKFKDQITV